MRVLSFTKIKIIGNHLPCTHFDFQSSRFLVKDCLLNTKLCIKLHFLDENFNCEILKFVSTLQKYKELNS